MPGCSGTFCGQGGEGWGSYSWKDEGAESRPVLGKEPLETGANQNPGSPPHPPSCRLWAGFISSVLHKELEEAAQLQMGI